MVFSVTLGGQIFYRKVEKYFFLLMGIELISPLSLSFRLSFLSRFSPSFSSMPSSVLFSIQGSELMRELTDRWVFSTFFLNLFFSFSARTGRSRLLS